MATTTDVRTTIYQLLNEIAPDKAPADDSANDETPMDTFLDSFDTFSLIQELEARFNIQIADEDASSENLGSIARVVQFVQKKQHA